MARLWITLLLFDGSLLVLWTLMQRYVAQALGHPALSVIDAWLLAAFRILFGLTTLAFVVTYVVLDVRVLVARSRRGIEREETS